MVRRRRAADPRADRFGFPDFEYVAFPDIDYVASPDFEHVAFADLEHVTWTDWNGRFQPSHDRPVDLPGRPDRQRRFA